MDITLEQCNQIIAELKATRNRQHDIVKNTTNEWNNLCNLQESYKRWPLKDLVEEAQKYGAEIATKRTDIITNIIIAHEERYIRQIEAAEHAIQDASEEIIEFGRLAASLKRESVA